MKTNRPAIFLGSTLEELRALPTDVRRVIGVALNDAQEGAEHPNAKALKGFGGRSVLEVVVDAGDTYRAVYTVRFKEAIYVLHVFQNKSKKGTDTPKSDLELIRARLRQAEVHHRDRYGSRA